MIIKTLIKHSEYHDSVSLMLIARELSQMEHVDDAAVVMATEANKGLLRNAGLLTGDVETARSNDLVIAIRAPEEVAMRALEEAEKMLYKKQAASDTAEYRPKTLRGACRATPSANVAVVSVAGRYAATEAWDALHQGLNVLLFSDNVSLEDEISLKRFAVDHGLLLMGPGAGTAILNGVALGFANVVPKGPVGIVAAAGTGLQEVSTQLASRGVGITQGIGTGGRDLREEVGGLMMLAGLEALQADWDTKVIVLVSKPPAEPVARKVLNQAACSEKPAVICFLGWEQTVAIPQPLRLARTLEEAARLAAEFAGNPQRDAEAILLPSVQRSFSPSQRFLRALFSGGTLCYEAQVIWRSLLAVPVFSNAPLNPAQRLKDSNRSQGHTAVDMGEEEFTVGRPHPMIDNDLRIRRLFQEARDPETAVVLLDVVIGYGAHPDPAVELAPAIQQACQIAKDAGCELLVVASVTGTDQDPQDLSRQVRELERVGVVVCPSNASAARIAGMVVQAAKI